MGTRRKRERALAEALDAAAKAGERAAYHKTILAAARNVLGSEVADVEALVRERGVSDALRAAAVAAGEVWPVRYREVLGPVLAAVAGAGSSGMPVLPAFTLANPRMRDWLSGYVSELSESLPATSYANFEGVLREALDSGLSVPDAASLVRERVGGLNKARSETIARTELSRSQRGARHLQVSESGVPIRAKVWKATRDDRTREEHAAMDGEEVADLDAPFSNGEVFPSSTNCRCYISYEISA